MKKNIYIISLLILLSACGKNFLNVADKSQLQGQLYIKDLQTTEEYLNGAYSMLGETFYSSSSLIYPELIADNIKPIPGSAALAAMYTWTQTAGDNTTNSVNLNATYKIAYAIIRMACLVIEKAEEYKEMNPNKAAALQGQGYALRALIHAHLANLFSQPYLYSKDASHPGIPYITSSKWTTPYSKQPAAEVYGNLVADLKKAIELLPQNSIPITSLGKNAARALLARIYLSMGKYHEAKALAREVSMLVPIMVGSTYPSKLFTPDEKEALFQIPPESTSYSTSFGGAYFSSTGGLGLIFVSTSDVASILKETANDKRSTWVTLVNGNWNITKYPSGVLAGHKTPASAYYLTILRSSEMYLTAAESYAKLNNEDSARYFLDEIRKRANDKAISTTATGNALLDSIYKERRKELCFEGLRVFDLLRCQQGVKRLDANVASAKELTYPNNKFIAPIPIQDVRLAGIAQNNDY